MKLASRLLARLRELRPFQELVIAAVPVILVAIPLFFLGSPKNREFNLCYMLPALFPFGLFVLDRNQNFRNWSRPRALLDLLVITISVIRVFIPLPLVSGHALFLSYASITATKTSTRIIAALFLCYTVSYKICHFDNLDVLYGGLICGIALALLYRIWPLKIEREAVSS